MMKNVNQLYFRRVKSENISKWDKQLQFLSFSYLSQFVGLFSLGHGGPDSERLAGLGSDAGTHFVCCLLLCFWKGRYLLLERLSSSVPQIWRASYLCGSGASEGRGHKPPCWGVDTEERCLWDLSGALVWTIWSLWAPASTAGMRSFVLMLRFIAFKM